jgi:uncharacterized protein (DUF302 family)|tara:strand:- start:671 stop:1105 length:435 start_codon:yes stop_codon:yes gene_type:complete
MIRETLLAMTLATPAMAEVMTSQTTKDVPAAMDALEAAVKESGAKVYARIDHTAEANSLEIEIVPAQLLVFGNPVVDTTAMQSDIQAGLMLPLRVLVYQGPDGDTLISHENVTDMFDGMSINVTADFVSKLENNLRMLTDKAVD